MPRAVIWFRKKGMFVRIYASHVKQYMEFLDELPEGMVQNIQKASVCKRLINPDSCNQRCPMGYDFMLKGVQQKKCRSNAFMFLVCDENNSYIRELIVKEAEACRG